MSSLRPSSFQILPPVIKNLLIINGLVFLAQISIGQKFHFYEHFALHSLQSSLFKPWQLVTHLFMHGDFFHLFSNMLALWMFGATLENLWGGKKFLVFYLVCGIGACLCHLAVLSYENLQLINKLNQLPYAEQLMNMGGVQAKLNEPTVGASGAVFGCLAAFGYLFPNMNIYIYFFIPLKAKWFVLIYAGFELMQGIQNSAGDNIAHFAHLGGAVFGFLFAYFWKKNQRNYY